MNSPNPVPCTWWDDTGNLVIYLRRYSPSAAGRPCPLRHGYHQAMAYVGGCADPPDGVSWHDVPELQVESYLTDERWPAFCGCGYEFGAGDKWQVFTDRVMVHDGETRAQRDLPVGAMYDASWYPEKGPDGIALVVVCPPTSECLNTWHVDGGAYKDGKVTHPAPAWTRTGDPRQPATLTCSPSIEIGFAYDAKTKKHQPGGPCYYHGHLQSGVLTPG